MTLFRSKRMAVATISLVLAFVLLALITPTSLYPESVAMLFYQFKWLDELAHLSLFFTLACFFKIAGCSWRRTVIVLFLFTWGTEFGQHFSGRMASISDVFFDIAGIALGLLFYYRFFNKKNNKTS